jgi:hypothetical protein
MELPIAFFILIAAVVITVAVYGIYAAARRRNDLRQWAFENNLSFSASSQYGLDDAFPQFDCLRQGSDRRAFNVIEGTYGGRKILAFDYQYTTGSGKDRSQHIFSAMIVTSPILLKPLLIRPENFMDRLGELVGFNHINFESDEFNRRFVVQSPDKKWAYDIITQQTMEFLLASPQFHIQFDTMYIIVWQDNTFSPADYAAAWQVADGLIKRFPEYVVQDQKLN